MHNPVINTNMTFCFMVKKATLSSILKHLSYDHKKYSKSSVVLINNKLTAV